MEINWLSSDFNHNKIILAGDIGGTNTNLALVGEKGHKLVGAKSPDAARYTII
jgi:glucokinase